MRKELKEIENNLIKSGWTLSVPARDDEMSEHAKANQQNRTRTFTGRDSVPTDISLR